VFLLVVVCVAATSAPAQTATRPGGAKGETLVFPIVADETDGPPDGSIVKLSRPTRDGASPPPTGKVVGRAIVVDGVSPDCEDILATAPDGTMADLLFTREGGKTQVGSAQFKNPRTLIVSVRDKAGVPLAGYRAQCRSDRTGMKYAMCQMSEPVPYDPVGPIVTLDSAGSARFEGLSSDAWFVAVWKADGPEPRHDVAGFVDLTPPGEKRADLVVERARRCVIHVTVDGQKKLPPAVAVRRLFDHVGPIEEDRSTATLRFEVRPHKWDTSLDLAVEGAGCAGAGYTGADVDLKLSADPSVVLEGSVDLTSGGDVRVRVLPAPHGLHDVGLETKDGSRWVPVEDVPFMVRERFADGWSFRLLPPGFYRARDLITGVATADVLLHSGRVGDLNLDLR
jgi:hypothetical protein